jgi:hypothetical protein
MFMSIHPGIAKLCPLELSQTYANPESYYSLTVKLKDIVPFCENTQRIEQECLGMLFYPLLYSL